MKLCIRLSLALVALSFSCQVFATPSKVRSYDFMCRDLQEKLQEEGKLIIIHAPFDASDTYQTSSLCNPGFETTPAYVKTKDKWFCAVGNVCMKRR